ncbi:MAG: HPr family phosphocarrier protein [Candidatus Limiplasma sp.]|nr:HPr family phosphocarrier protein [Candidatus Limiplasma sp.]
MIKTPYSLQAFLPFDRVGAALLAQTASRFECRLTLEREHTVLNAKSMLGLLSHHSFGDGLFTLVADGEDEQAAIKSLLELIHS